MTGRRLASLLSRHRFAPDQARDARPHLGGDDRHRSPDEAIVGQLGQHARGQVGSGREQAVRDILPQLTAGDLRMVEQAGGPDDRPVQVATTPAESRLELQDDDTMRALRDYLQSELVVRIAEFLGGPDATERAAAAVGVIGGLIFTRYLNPIRPLATLPATEARRVFGPALRAALHTHARRR